MAKYLILAVAATLLVACEAGWWATPVNPPSQNTDANQQHYYYQNRDANQQRYYYQNRDANQQGYNYQDRDANQQRYYYQNRDANQQGYYYQNRDANQQGYYYQDRDANQQGYYYKDAINQQNRDANQQRYYYQNKDATANRHQDALQQGYYYRYYGYRYANQQASSCVLQFEPPSRTFTICVKQDEICTNISVPACTSSAMNCQQIDNQLLEKFEQMHPDVYAQECTETSGGHCLYTDIIYDTCSTAKAMEDKFCVKLTDGTERCTTKQDLENLAKAAQNENDGNLPSNS